MFPKLRLTISAFVLITGVTAGVTWGADRQAPALEKQAAAQGSAADFRSALERGNATPAEIRVLSAQLKDVRVRVDGADIPNYGIAMAALSSGEIRDPSLRTVRAAVVNSLLGLAVDRLLYDSGRAAGHRGPGATGLRKLADEQTREYRVGNGARFTTRAAASAYFHSSQFMAFYVRNVIEAQEKADIMGVKGGVLTPATEHAAIEKLRAWVRVQFARRASVTGWDGMSEQMLSAMAK